jgi:outer membrane protein OmpA-like peptidoglycan-associated protein
MKKITGLCLVAALSTGCATDPYTGESKVSNAAWGTAIGAVAGAASGAAIGAAVDGKDGAATGAIIGAGSGAVIGTGVGYYMDRQESQLRARLEGTGVRVQRLGDDLKLIMPGNITFRTNSATINGNFYSILDSVNIVLNEFDETSINISGYTDSVGSDMHNQELSEHRANSVASYIVKGGVRHGRIQARGMGERYPVASNKTEVGRAQNRRVEISIRQK